MHAFQYMPPPIPRPVHPHARAGGVWRTCQGAAQHRLAHPMLMHELSCANSWPQKQENQHITPSWRLERSGSRGGVVTRPSCSAPALFWPLPSPQVDHHSKHLLRGKQCHDIKIAACVVCPAPHTLWLIARPSSDGFECGAACGACKQHACMHLPPPMPSHHHPLLCRDLTASTHALSCCTAGCGARDASFTSMAPTAPHHHRRLQQAGDTTNCPLLSHCDQCSGPLSTECNICGTGYERDSDGHCSECWVQGALGAGSAGCSEC